jgi:hypothetical protein
VQWGCENNTVNKSYNLSAVCDLKDFSLLPYCVQDITSKALTPEAKAHLNNM